MNIILSFCLACIYAIYIYGFLIQKVLIQNENRRAILTVCIAIIQGCCHGGSVGEHGQDNTGQLAPAQGRLQDCASRQLSLKRKKEKIITLKIYFLCKALGDDFKTLYKWNGFQIFDHI